MYQSGRYQYSRRDNGDLALSEEFFHDMLKRLDVEYVDVMNIQMVDRADDFEKVTGPGGLLEMAERFRSQGKGRFIGLSTHESAIGLKAIASGRFDTVMIGMNLNWPQPEVPQACVDANVGLVIMKPFSGGEFFYPPYSNFITPVKALSYLVAQKGVSTIVPGVRNVEQLWSVLAYLTATEEERDFREIVATMKERIMGTCTYCAHCLPCPVGIPINDLMFSIRA